MCDLKKLFQILKDDFKQWRGEDWIRWRSAEGYLLISLISFVIYSLLKIDILKSLNENMASIFWTSGWSSVGISAWLVNSRGRKQDERNKQYWHYVLYFGFALIISSLAAFALGRYENGDLNLSLSALIGLTMGFASERLNELDPIKGKG